MVSASELDLDITGGCLDITVCALAREHGELLSDWLSGEVQKWAQMR